MAAPAGRRSLVIGLLQQSVFVTVAVLVYFGGRNITQGQVDRAESNARDLLRIEELFRIDFEIEAQDLILGNDTLVTLTNWVYIWGHWPVLIGALVWLYVRHRQQYSFLRNGIFISGLVGMIIFALYPVAPPRLLSADYVDTVTSRSNSYRVLQPPALTNKYAAFPSLHFGWNLIVGITLWRTGRSFGLQSFGAILPTLMAAAVVLTANHYTIDVIGGGLVALGGLAAARWLAKRSGDDGNDHPTSTSDHRSPEHDVGPEHTAATS